MAIQRFSLTSGGGTSNNSFATASVSPGSNRRQMLAVFNRAASGSPEEPSVSGNGLTWTKVGTQTFTSFGATTTRVTLFKALGASPSSGSATISFVSGQQSCYWSWVEYSGVDTGDPGLGTPATNSGNSSTASATLGSFTDGSWTYAVVGASATLSPAITPETLWTQIDYLQPTVRERMLTEEYGGADTSPSASVGTVTGWGIVAVEIKAAPAASSKAKWLPILGAG